MNTEPSYYRVQEQFEELERPTIRLKAFGTLEVPLRGWSVKRIIYKDGRDSGHYYTQHETRGDSQFWCMYCHAHLKRMFVLTHPEVEREIGVGVECLKHVRLLDASEAAIRLCLTGWKQHEELFWRRRQSIQWVISQGEGAWNYGVSDTIEDRRRVMWLGQSDSDFQAKLELARILVDGAKRQETIDTYRGKFPPLPVEAKRPANRKRGPVPHFRTSEEAWIYLRTVVPTDAAKLLRKPYTFLERALYMQKIWEFAWTHELDEAAVSTFIRGFEAFRFCKDERRRRR